MKFKFLLIGIIAVLFFSVSAESADWLNYVEGKDGALFYVDMESIKPTSENTISISKKVEPAGSSDIASVLSEVEMDCNNSMIHYLKETTRFKDGKSQSSWKNEKFRKVTVEDNDEALLELICSLKKSK
ncbi:hypothetical protein BMS3Abin09_00971 [bacterium BMS3Abin09]|nr:hypothetical protein BMS3Abin09_00971 [bacterium BMS3Abin09]GBE40544.1 hypothetical protein BMS3Bbin09_00426 [bacterium BMS3Bbin09]HDH34343.1 hypothetical protein [Nitrospirota bacterium]HDO66848.1 hypothetical protein [Nitrospirota bacterium]HEW81022.1 hypothetical protein [Nitrospirota bacterium]